MIKFGLQVFDQTLTLIRSKVNPIYYELQVFTVSYLKNKLTISKLPTLYEKAYKV